MSDDHDEDAVEITLKLMPKLAAQLDELRGQVGDQLVIDLIGKANAAIEGKLALRGSLPHSKS